MHGGASRPALAPTAKGYQDVSKGPPRKNGSGDSSPFIMIQAHAWGAGQPGLPQLRGIKMCLRDPLGRNEQHPVPKKDKKCDFVQTGGARKNATPQSGASSTGMWSCGYIIH